MVTSFSHLFEEQPQRTNVLRDIGVNVQTSICPVHPSIHPSPSPMANIPPNQAKIKLSKLQICPTNLKSFLQTNNQPYKLKIISLRLKFAIQSLNLLSKPQLCPLGASHSKSWEYPLTLLGEYGETKIMKMIIFLFFKFLHLSFLFWP